MQHLLKEIEKNYKKTGLTSVRSGDTVKVHQRIKEGAKERIQIFEGLVINTRRMNSATAAITVRRIASGVGVEKVFKMHSPLIEKVDVVKRSKVRRNNLSYMRERSGKSARLANVGFDQDTVNYKEAVAEVAEVEVPGDVPVEVEAPVVEEVAEKAEETTKEVAPTKDEVKPDSK